MMGGAGELLILLSVVYLLTVMSLALGCAMLAWHSAHRGSVLTAQQRPHSH